MPKTLDEISSDNDFFIGCAGSGVVFLKPIPQKITRDQALRLAAWIVAIADPDDEFGLYIEKICNT